MMHTFLSPRRLLAATLLLFCTTWGSAQQGASKAQSTQEQWMTFYYKNPQPEGLPEEVRQLSRAGQIKNSTQPPISAFLSQIMAQNPKRIAAWMASLDDLPVADKKALYLAIAYSHTAEGAKFFEEKGLKEYQTQAPEILEMEVNNPETLDMLWGYFMATGKEAPIRRIVSAFNLSPYAGALERYITSKKTEADKKAASLDVALQAACWSLRSNCKEHPRVREICDALLAGNSLNPVEHKWLAVILKQQDSTAPKSQKFEDVPTWKSKNGFGAALLLTEDGKFFDDWAKPETPRLTTTNTARRNVPLHTVLEFNNPGLNPDGTADITADIKTLKPDGSVYGEEKNVVCWKGKYAAPAANLQLAQAHMALRIEPQDPAGVYTVEITVRDNVKKIELPLKTTFEVPK